MSRVRRLLLERNDDAHGRFPCQSAARATIKYAPGEPARAPALGRVTRWGLSRGRTRAHQRSRADLPHRDRCSPRPASRFFVADQHMSAVEGSLGFLPRRILVDARTTSSAARRLLQRSRPCRRTARWLKRLRRPASTRSSAVGSSCGKSRAGHRVGADAVLLAAAAGPPARRLDRCRRRRRRGRPRAVAALAARRASTSSKSTPSSPRWRATTPRSTALRRARAIAASTRSTARRAARPDLPTARPISSSPIRRSSSAANVRASPDAARARAHVARAARRRLALEPGSSPASRCSRRAGAS